MHRCDINRFGEANYSLPLSCLVSVYGSPNAVPSLHYTVPLVGVADSDTLYIHRSLRTTPPLSPPPLTSNKAKIDADPPSFIKKRTEWINGQYNCRHYYNSASFANMSYKCTKR